MSTATMLVHVPVDEIMIVRGSLSRDDLIRFRALLDAVKSIEMKVTLKTKASDKTFNRTIKIAHVALLHSGRRSDDTFLIIGYFGRQKIEGTYRTASRKGTFRSAD